ncbi:MAG: pirin family protein [Acidimicrobiales bacterium]
MPAATADTLTLPRLPEPAPSDRERTVRLITTAPRGFEGEGFPVKRAFAGVPQEALDPFIHLDEMGSIDYGPGEPRGTSWHPHRGFETVTYILDGTFQHQDSHGGGGVISDGDTQWMTAGAGILHIETPPEWLVTRGGLFHGLQLWVNLPAAQKWSPPRYQSLEGRRAAMVASDDGGALVRIVAGEVGGQRGPGATHTPMALVHATIAPGARLYLPWHSDFNALAYVMGGSGRVGPDHNRRPIRAGQLAVFGAGDHLSMTANPTQDSSSASLEVIVLGGRPIGEPVAWYGPFVMNTKAELMQTMEDYRAGRLGVVPPNALMPHVPR